MEEWLALPAPCSVGIELSAWVNKLAELGFAPALERDDSNTYWIEISALRLRGYAVLEGLFVDAINFELHDIDPSRALEVLKNAVRLLNWELYQDDEDDDPED